MNASVDVFNLLNFEHGVESCDDAEFSDGESSVTEVTGPRVLRFGLRFTF